jgi:hypothetical protein
MKYLCDLNYDEYDDLVLFQIQDTRESSIIPTENILDIFTENTDSNIQNHSILLFLTENQVSK